MAVPDPKELARLCERLAEWVGSPLTPAGRNSLERRVRDRISGMGLGTVGEYARCLEDEESRSREMIHLVDPLLPSRPPFMARPGDLEFLLGSALPALVRHHGAGINRPLVAWSAECATGEEAYTLAFHLCEFSLQSPGLGFQFLVLGTDSSSLLLDLASRAVYGTDRLGGLPLALRGRYLLKSRDPHSGLVRVGPDVRSRVRFRVLDLQDSSEGFREPIDLIFCRHLHLPERERQRQFVRRLLDSLAPAGFLFLGRYEALGELEKGLIPVAPGVFQRREE